MFLICRHLQFFYSCLKCERGLKQENNPRRRVKCTLAAACSGACLLHIAWGEREERRRKGRKRRENSTTVFNQTAVGKAVRHGRSVACEGKKFLTK